MNTNDYSAIGRAIKLLYPGELDDIPDDVAGMIAEKKGLWPPPQQLIDKYPHFFLGTRTEHIANQHQFISAQITKDANIASQQVTVQHTLTELPRRLEEESELKDRDFAQKVLADERAKLEDQTARQGQHLGQHLIAEADKLLVDVTTYNTIRLKEEENRLALEKRQKEMMQDVEAAMIVNSSDKHLVIHILEQIMKLIEKGHQIKVSDKPQEVKDRQLELLNEVIDGLRGDIRTLQAVSGPDRPGIQDPSKTIADSGAKPGTSEADGQDEI